MKLFDVVKLVSDRPEDSLAAGSVGTIVHVFDKPDLAYEVEFADANGRTLALVTLRPDQLQLHSP
jgi:hypothetical protein